VNAERKEGNEMKIANQIPSRITDIQEKRNDYLMKKLEALWESRRFWKVISIIGFFGGITAIYVVLSTEQNPFISGSIVILGLVGTVFSIITFIGNSGVGYQSDLSQFERGR